MSLAEDHVDWFLAAIRPLLIDFFEHGFKHGREYDFEESVKNEEECQFKKGEGWSTGEQAGP
jgi:hypothetical protein